MRMLVAVVLALIGVVAEAQSGLAAMDFIIGQWEGTSRGEPGEGKVQRTCTKVLNDRFIECRTTVTYAKEVHVEAAWYSYDKGAKKLRLRQFHGEGFVNSYIEGDALVFTTTEIENIPAGWRARETYERVGEDEWRERFELAPPGKELAVYTSSTLKRVR